MSFVANTPAQGNAIVLRLASMDELECSAEKVLKAWSRIRELIDKCFYSSGDAEEALSELKTLSVQYLQSIRDDIEAGLDKADEKMVRQQIAALLGSFPASTAPDPQVYVKLMIAEVLAASPSEHALDRVCRKIRRSAKWPPPIAEVLQEIKDAEFFWYLRHKAAMDMPEQRAAAATKISAERDRLADIEAERRSRNSAAQIALPRRNEHQPLPIKRSLEVSNEAGEPALDADVPKYVCQATAQCLSERDASPAAGGHHE